MDETRPVDAEVAARAQQALMTPLADLLETAAECCASPDLAHAATQIVGLCRDATVLAEALTIIARRTAP